jgi:uncharacterized membrane protein
MRTETAGATGEAPHPTIGKTGMFGDNIAGMLAYCTIFPAIIFLVLDPYKKNQFIRFHSFQSLLLWVAGVVLGAVLLAVTKTLSYVPFLGALLNGIIGIIVSIFTFTLWVVLIVKALQGEKFKLPVIGEWAERAAEN